MKLPLRTPALLAATVAALAVAIPSTAAAHNRVKEYPLAEFAVPADITTGPDNALYVTDGSLGRLWRVTTKGKVSSFELGGGPAGVATGRDGALWVTDRNGRIQRVTTGGAITNYSLPAGSFPNDIVAGPDGALWFTDSRRDKIGRITTGGDKTEYAIPTPGAFAGDITVGPDGALWFTEQVGNKVGRITMSGDVTEFPLATADSLPGPIVSGRDGALYFAERNTYVIARMDTAGHVTREFPLPSQDVDPVALVSTRHGLWIAERGFPGSVIGQMSLRGCFGRELGTKSAPDVMTLGPDGNLWYASSNEPKVGRVEIDR